MDPSYRGLAFLLSLGTLPLACKPENGTTDSDGTTTGGPTTDSPTGSGTSGGSTGASDGMTTTSGTGTATGTGTTGGTNPTTGETETGSPAGICDTYAAHSVMCDASLNLDEETMLCESDRKSAAAINGEACLALYDAVLACFSMQPCDADTGCDAEVDAFYNCSPAIGEVCKAYGMKYAECLMMNADMGAKYCQTNVNASAYMSGPMCGTAYEDFYACLTGQACADFEMQKGCDAEAMALETACGG